MLEQRVQFHAVEVTPRAMQVLPRLRLLPGVVVVQELVNYAQRLLQLARRLLLVMTIGDLGPSAAVIGSHARPD